MADASNRQSWDQWFDRHGSALVLLARQWCGSLADAEDAVQEGFVRFWRTRTQAHDPAAYLYVCVKHAALDRRRGDARRRQREQAAAAAQTDATRQGELFETDLELQERIVMIEQHLQTLPAEQREVLVMKLWGELTFAQIAEAAGVSINTAASRYRYGLDALRRAMPQEQLL